MSLRSPWLLAVLVLVPVAVFAYSRVLHLRARRSARLAAEGLVPTVAAKRSNRRRHVPFALFVAALALIGFSLARPSMVLSLPQREGTVILAFDVSNSMRAKDLEPTRLDAAKKAAVGFVERQPGTIRVGVVAFGDSAVTVLRPTNVKADAIAAVNRLSIGGGTSLGQGLFTSLSTIAGKPLQIDPSALGDEGAEVNVGYFGSSAIVLLSDGENTSQPDPLKVAEIASSAGVRVHTVGVGSEKGTTVKVDGFEVATALDAKLLTEIAKVTDGTYSEAADAETLAGIYDSIDVEFKHVEKKREVTALFAAAGGLLLALGAGLSIVWFGRVI
jgi:Ca-activated chloride channel family protein